MKSKKLMIVYIVMLIIVVAIMVINKNHKPVAIQDRDYPEIRKEGILHLETEYSQAGYYVSEDTIQGFHYELGQAIAKVSGLSYFETSAKTGSNIEQIFRELAEILTERQEFQNDEGSAQIRVREDKSNCC